MERPSFAARLQDAGINAITTVAVSGLALAGAVATGWSTFAGKDQELRVHLVEIAIGILRADPKEDVPPARQWAIDVIERDSGVTFTVEDRAALLHKGVESANTGRDTPINDGWGTTRNAYPARRSRGLKVLPSETPPKPAPSSP